MVVMVSKGVGCGSAFLSLLFPTEKSSMAATPAEGKPPVEGARRTSEDDARPRGTSSSSEGESFPSALPAPTLAVDEPLEQLTIFTGTWNMGEDEGPEAGYLRYWLDQGRIPGADDAKERGDLAPEGVRSNLQGMQPRDVKGGKRRKSQKEVVPPLSVPLPSERLFDLYAIGVQECMEMGILVKKMKAVIGPGYVVTRHRIGTRLRGLGYHGYIGLLLFVKVRARCALLLKMLLYTFPAISDITGRTRYLRFCPAVQAICGFGAKPVRYKGFQQRRSGHIHPSYHSRMGSSSGWYQS